MKKQLYKWHRTVSVIIAFPVLLWAASGFMHPIMTNIRPKITTQGLAPVVVDSNRIRVPLQVALRQHHLESWSNVRLVHIDTNWFYQVQLVAAGAGRGGMGNDGRRGGGGDVAGRDGGGDVAGRGGTDNRVPVYLSATNGKVLPAGDWLYAQYLARQFLEGQERAGRAAATSTQATMVTKVLPAVYTALAAHDCCGAATDCVLNSPKGAKVANVSLLRDFDDEYKSINRLLPVYRVSFDRPDGIRVYVETTQDRFAFAMDDKRFVFDRIFTLIHTWGWLEFLGKGKLVIEFGLVFLAFLTTLMGIYLFFTTTTKKINGNELVRARRNHRYVSIAIALFTLMFTFSGAFHALSKFKEDTRGRYFVDPVFVTDSVHFDLSRLYAAAGAPITNISLVRMYGRSYWQITTADKTATPHRDLMKDLQSPSPSVCYLHTDDLSVLPQGESVYAGFLASTFSGESATAILSTAPVTRFASEYNFTDKRLPVWKVSYAAHDHERYYVETSTGRLSKRVDDKSLIEDYSFAFLHKHEFMAWGGKGLKDCSTMFWALAQIVMVTVGLVLYFKRRKKKISGTRI